MSVTSSINPKAVIVAGPTAAGKSALALAIAEEFDGILINADSQQRYADLRVLTSRPSVADEARAPHRLFGDLQSHESGSAAEWALKAAAEIQTAVADKKLPILVGGTGLYFRALTEGLTEMPAVPAETRAAAKALLDEIGNAAFHARLAERDSVTGARLNPGDTQRMLRAWEVSEATGRPLSAWHELAPTPPLAASYFSILMLPPRAELYATCDARFEAMVAEGGLEEVRALLDRGIASNAGAAKALGVPDLAAYLEGEVDLSTATNLAKIATADFQAVMA